MQKVFLFLFFFIGISTLTAQQTVGLFLNDSTSFNGYTLIPTTSSTETHLIDNCGELIHSWSSNNSAGMQAYLLEDGRLLRAERITNSFNAGGSGGRVVLLDWDSNLLWGYDYSSDTYHQHHDVAYLPNGNILVIAWETRTTEEAIALGRDPANLGENGVWPDHIVELEPVGTNEVNIVWEWHVWDHLVQDFDESKANFGVVAAHPELIDINIGNLTGAGAGATDWNHVNSIDYNPELDQIILSSRSFNEIWVIDHSTTTEEAATHSGGNSGKGGDLLYRWGNPTLYGQGSETDQKLFGQHDAHWIPAGLPDAGKIMIFNNGPNRPEGNYSTIDVIDPEMDDNGNYLKTPMVAFGPTTLTWAYQAEMPLDFYEQRISGAQQQPNGNLLICAGRQGLFFEVNQTGEKVWEYLNPVSNFGPVIQGNANNTGSTFRVYRYASDYPAFTDKDLTPQGPIELNPLPSNCQIYENPTTSVTTITSNQLTIYPNPVSTQLWINNESEELLNYRLFDLRGQEMDTGRLTRGTIQISTAHLAKGMYILQIFNLEQESLLSRKLIRQ